jgi:1,2-diacylglycerol 3-beta-glucosyltransferase
VGTALAVLTAAFGSAAAAAGLYLLGLTAAAAAYRGRHLAGLPTARLVALVPAHDEASTIARCVASLLAQAYPGDLFRVVVIADNCVDGTAGIAVAAGADVLVRDEPTARGKGHALNWAIEHLASSDPAPDAFVFVDADSVADPGLAAALEGELRRGADAAQANYEVLLPEGDRLRAAALALFNHVRSQGREVLGLPAQLLGNGMIVRRAVLERLPWTAFSPVEDLEYTLRLCLGGFRTAFTPAARVLGPLPPTRAAATTQRLRWEGGRFLLLRQHWRELLRGVFAPHGLAVAEVLFSLAVPPIAAVGLVIALGGVASAAMALGGLAPLWPALPWALAGAALAGHVLWGLRLVGAPAATYIALLRAPYFVAWKLTVYARIALGGFDPTRWERTPRVAEVRRR